jgi:AcrR family transcriptional regulator
MAAKSSPKKGKVTSIKPVKERVVAAALDLAARMGWDMITLSDIADKAHCTLAELCEYFDDKGDILTAYERGVDKRVLEAFAAVDLEAPERDRLFDILMERFDVLNDNRDAMISVLKSFTLDPKQAVIGLPHLGRSMAWMLEAAGIDSSGAKGALKVAGLTALYIYALRAWSKDESADLSKTMAAVDRGLGRIEQAANTFSFLL